MSNFEKMQIVVVGESGVGKTCLLNKYFQNIFPEQKMETESVEYFLKEETVKDKKIRLKIWDVSGKELNKEIARKLFKSCHGVILVFDVTDTISFYKLKETFEDIKESNDDKKTNTILIGNKIDQNIKIPFELGLKMAEDNNSFYFETSAKEDNNINLAFKKLISEILDSKSK